MIASKAQLFQAVVTPQVQAQNPSLLEAVYQFLLATPGVQTVTKWVTASCLGYRGAAVGDVAIL